MLSYHSLWVWWWCVHTTMCHQLQLGQWGRLSRLPMVKPHHYCKRCTARVKSSRAVWATPRGHLLRVWRNTPRALVRSRSLKERMLVGPRKSNNGCLINWPFVVCSRPEAKVGYIPAKMSSHDWREALPGWREKSQYVPVVVRTIYTSARPLSNSSDKPRAVAVIFYFNSISSSYHVITSTFLKYRTRSVKQDLLLSKSFRVQIRVQTSGILTKYWSERNGRGD